jgi:hypothetical protein
MSHQDWSYLLSAVVYAGFEYWLGRTPKTKAGSVLELALSVAKAALSRRK